MDAIEFKTPLKDVPGIAWLENGKLKETVRVLTQQRRIVWKNQTIPFEPIGILPPGTPRIAQPS